MFSQDRSVFSSDLSERLVSRDRLRGGAVCCLCLVTVGPQRLPCYCKNKEEFAQTTTDNSRKASTVPFKECRKSNNLKSANTQDIVLGSVLYMLKEDQIRTRICTSSVRFTQIWAKTSAESGERSTARPLEKSSQGAASHGEAGRGPKAGAISMGSGGGGLIHSWTLAATGGGGGAIPG